MRHAILITAAVLLGSGTAFAQRQSCDNHILSHTYGVQISGSRPSAPGPLAPTEPVVGVGLAHFDGRGGYTQTGWTHGGISGVASAASATGTYNVNPDCSGTVTFQYAGQPFAIHVAIVVVGDGDEVKGATMEPAGILVTANWRQR